MLLSSGKLTLQPAATLLSWPSACTASQPMGCPDRPPPARQLLASCASLACALLSASATCNGCSSDFFQAGQSKAS